MLISQCVNLSMGDFRLKKSHSEDAKENWKLANRMKMSKCGFVLRTKSLFSPQIDTDSIVPGKTGIGFKQDERIFQTLLICDFNLW